MPGRHVVSLIAAAAAAAALGLLLCRDLTDSWPGATPGPRDMGEVRRIAESIGLFCRTDARDETVNQKLIISAPAHTWNEAISRKLIISTRPVTFEQAARVHFGRIDNPWWNGTVVACIPGSMHRDQLDPEYGILCGEVFLYGDPAVVRQLVEALSQTQEPPGKPPARVKIEDEKSVVRVSSEPIDPAQHIQMDRPFHMAIRLRVNNHTLHLDSIQTTVHADGRVFLPGAAAGQPLPMIKDGQPRTGFRSVFQHQGKLFITQEVEVVATKCKADQKRRRDAAMVRYFVENKDTRPHTVGIRVFMDVFIVNNDGALFAAPNQPGKILDGVELKGKMIPDYLQFLQKPSLENPGFVAHMTYHFGKSFERPDRIVLTSLGAPRDQWNLVVMQAGGDSAMAVYWEPREIKPGGKVQMAYAYGQGIAPTPDGEGAVALVLGGSFEPGKLFSVAAKVQDPALGQTLTLELPSGIERVEGKECQPVGAVDGSGNSMVLWKARVLDLGRYTLRVHSSTGITHTRIITITRPERNQQ
jgi:hypothetical protein